MQWIVTGAVWSALLAMAVPALAQTERGPWVAGRIVLDADESWNVPVPTGVGGGVSFGVDLSRRLGFELAMDWPPVRTIQTIRTTNDRNGPVRTTQRNSYQSPGGIGFVAIRALTESRVQLRFLIGLGFLSHRSTYDGLVEHLDVSGNVVSQSEGVVRGRFPWGGPAVGIEMPVQLSRRLAVVPTLHAIWLPIADTGPSTAILRPAIGVRWSF